MKLRKCNRLGGKLNWISSCFDPLFSIFLSAFTAATHNFNAPSLSVQTTIITLEPCALNAEFQHVRPTRFNQLFVLCGLIEGYGKEAQRQGEDRVTLMKTLIPWQFWHWNLEILPKTFPKTNIILWRKILNLQE